MPSEPQITTEQACERIVRELEICGSEMFSKHFIKDGKTIATVWAAVGPNSAEVRELLEMYAANRGFKEDPAESA